MINIKHITEKILEDFSLENYNNLSELEGDYDSDGDETWQVNKKPKYKVTLRYSGPYDKYTTIWIGDYHNILDDESAQKLLILIKDLKDKRKNDLKILAEKEKERFLVRVFGKRVILGGN